MYPPKTLVQPRVFSRKQRTIRCPDCTDWIKHARLTLDEQTHRLDDIVNRPDDPRHEMLALRFMGKRMLEDPFGFLAIYGHKGGGKSLLLTALVAEFCRLGKHAVYFNAAELVTALSPGDENVVDGLRLVGNYEAAKRRLKEIPVLAIDEIDKIKWSSWQVQHIGEVLEFRHRNCAKLVTIFAMNKPPATWSNAPEVGFIGSRMSDGRFYRLWFHAFFLCGIKNIWSPEYPTHVSLRVSLKVRIPLPNKGFRVYLLRLSIALFGVIITYDIMPYRNLFRRNHAI